MHIHKTVIPCCAYTQVLQKRVYIVRVADRRKYIGQYIKALSQPVLLSDISRENDTSEVQCLKQLVERMICPEASERCKIAEVCQEIQRIRGKPI